MPDEMIPDGTFHTEAARCDVCGKIYPVTDDTERHDQCPACEEKSQLSLNQDREAQEQEKKNRSEFDDAGVLLKSYDRNYSPK
jgi:uncharacterized protein YbaR (Trm112 family)